MARVTGLNHVTLAVSDLDHSLAFYRDLLGMAPRARWATGAYLEAGSLWLCLSAGPVAPRVDDTHLAFDVEFDDFAALSAKVRSVAPVWRENVSEGSSLYMLDPDGHQLELHVGSLASRLTHYAAHPEKGVEIFAGPPGPDRGRHRP